MRRRRGSGRFSAGEAAYEDINPMDGLGNLADVMLVFACGLMLALITYWNVDVAATVAPDVSAERLEITEDLPGADNQEDPPPDQEGLEEYGTVYRDPATGQLYILSEDK